MHAGDGAEVRLERRDPSGWHTVAAATARSVAAGRADTGPDGEATGDETADATATLRVPPQPGDAAYRVALGASRAPADTTSTGTTTSADATSAEFSIFPSDHRRHAEDLARAGAAVREYCPQTPIYIDSPEVQSGAVLGKARSQWSWVGDRASWTQSIQLRSGLDPATLRHTALHECAHIVQVRPLVDGAAAYARSRDRAAAAYPAEEGEPGEQQADCMAFVVTHRTAEMYYRRTCSAAQVADAARMWERYGTGRWSPTLRWTWRP